MSKKRYCEEKRINEATPYYWFSRSRENQTDSDGFIAIYKVGKSSDVEVIFPLQTVDSPSHYQSLQDRDTDEQLTSDYSRNNLVCTASALLTQFEVISRNAIQNLQTTHFADPVFL